MEPISMITCIPSWRRVRMPEHLYAPPTGRSAAPQEPAADGPDAWHPKPTDYNRDAFMQAARDRNLDYLSRVIEGTSRFNPFFVCDVDNALREAAVHGSVEIARRLLDQGATLDLPERCEWRDPAHIHKGPCSNCKGTALQIASGKADYFMVQLLLKRGADANFEPNDYGGRTALQVAAERGHTRIFKNLLAAGAEVNGRPCEHYGRTALQAAAEQGNAAMVKTLLAAGADINGGPSRVGGRTALQAAAEKGDAAMVEMLLAAGADINGGPSRVSGRTALQAAAGGGHEGIVTTLLAVGANVHGEPSSEGGRTALQAAAGGGYAEIVTILLEKGAEVDDEPSNSSGRTALQAAAEGGHEGIVTTLLAVGANVNCKPSSEGGRTALQAAAERGHESIVVTLLGAGAHVNGGPSESFGRTALQAAAGEGHEGVVKILLEEGAKVDGEPSYAFGRTALQAAAEGGHEDIVTTLLAVGAEVDGKPSSAGGRTALQAAAERGHESIVVTLLGAGADVNGEPSDSSGRTALQAAAGGGHDDIVRILLEEGAKVDGEPSYAFGRTALQAAAEGGHAGVVKTLLRAGAVVNGNTSRYDKSALQVAAGQGHMGVVESLLAVPADVDGGPSGEGSRTALQEAAAGRFPEVVSSLPNQSNQLINSHHNQLLISGIALPEVVQYLLQAGINPSFQDRDGATPLHHAVRGGHTCSAALLLLAGADPCIRDYGGLNLLDLAFEGDRGCRAQVLRILLRFGCDIRGSPIELWRRSFAQSHESFLTIYEAPFPHPGVASTIHKKRNIQAANKAPPQSINSGKKTIEVLFPHDLPSVMDTSVGARCLHRPKQDIHTILKEGRGVKGFGSIGGHAECDEEKTPSTIQWRWYRRNPHRTLGGNQEGQGLPNVGTMATDGESQALLTCYVSLDCWVQSGVQGGGPGTAFGVSAGTSGVQWTMRKPCTSTQDPAPILRTVDFIGVLDIACVPHDAVDFFNLFIIDLHKKWRDFIEKADIHLHQSRRTLLERQGKSVGFIEVLLADAQTWSDSRSLLQIQLRTARNMVTDFSETQYLQAEVTGFPAAIGKLTETIDDMEKEVSKELEDLDERTQKMIELEFNLVSIYESRTSKEMGMSMKRLSWITFVFLPLMFVASIFGMNIDIINGGPKWTWVIILAVALFTVAILAWSLLKLSLDKAKSINMKGNWAHVRPRWGFWRKYKDQEDLEQGASYGFRRPQRVWTRKLKYN